MSQLVNTSPIAPSPFCKGKYQLLDAASSVDFNKVIKLIEEVTCVKTSTNRPQSTQLHGVAMNLPSGLVDSGATGVKPVSHRSTPLHKAASNGHAAVCTALVEAGAAVDAKDKNDRTPLHLAAKKGRVSVCAALVAAGAAVDVKDWKDNWISLHLAARNGHAAVCTALVAAGAAVDAKDWADCTPLHHAAKKGHAAVCVALVEAGAAVDGKDRGGHWTPLHKAAMSGHAAVCTALVAAGAAVDAKDSYNRTPLHRAAWYGHAAVCAALVGAGAAVDAQDVFGTTALYLAAKANCNQAVRFLLGAGADVAKSAEYFSAAGPLPGAIQVLFLAASARGCVAGRSDIPKRGGHIRQRLDDGFTTLQNAALLDDVVLDLERACHRPAGWRNRAVLATMRSFASVLVG